MEVFNGEETAGTKWKIFYQRNGKVPGYGQWNRRNWEWITQDLLFICWKLQRQKDFCNSLFSLERRAHFIVSIGTSLPELVTSIVAARKNEVDMAHGNAIGSNVFNILKVLGIASAISPISIITENIIDLCVLIVFTVCVWIFAGTRKKIGKIEGVCMVALYAVYAVCIIIR